MEARSSTCHQLMTNSSPKLGIGDSTNLQWVCPRPSNSHYSRISVETGNAKKADLRFCRLRRVLPNETRVGRCQGRSKDDQLERLHTTRLGRIHSYCTLLVFSPLLTTCFANIDHGQGPYHYSTKSKASWYWSRTWRAAERLSCQYWILTDWKRWVFGTFDKNGEHGWVSPLLSYDASDPTILQTMLYWSRYVVLNRFYV